MEHDLLVYHIIAVIIVLLLFILNSYFKIQRLKRKVTELESNVGNKDVVSSRKTRINQDITKLQRKTRGK